MAGLITNYIDQDPIRIFKDLNIAFTQHPTTGDVTTKNGDAAIKQALRNLILLNRNEKPFHPEIGGGIYDLLFENMDDPGMTEVMRLRLTALIQRYEPRIDLEGITIESNDNNSLSIGIYYVILNTLTPSNVDIFLKTIR